LKLTSAAAQQSMSNLDPTPLLGTRERPRRDRVLSTLANFLPALNALGLDDVRLFGSVARDEASSTSDIDLLATVKDTKSLDVDALVNLQGDMSVACRAAVNLCLLGVDRHSVVALCRFHPDLLGHIQGDLIPIGV
jgi:predicted nucleotidyltransferase